MAASWSVFYVMISNYVYDVMLNLRFNYKDNDDTFYYANYADYSPNIKITNPEFTINRVTVPEPDSVILLLLGLAGLSFARYRKQS